MAEKEPLAEVEPQFSSDGATATPWSAAREALEQAEVYWLATVRPEGRPHVTPLIGIWLDGALYFCTGPTERKAKNLAHNSQVVVTTGSNTMQGLDVVLEGSAVQVSDEARLQRLAEMIDAKYEFWHFTVRDGAYYGEGGRALVYEVAPTTAFGFARGEPFFSQTRWRF